MCLLVAAGSFVLAVAINLLLFQFGPWADVWIEQTWVGLALVGGVGAFVSRRRWLRGGLSRSL
jgi:hypothetical protein